MLPYQYLPTLQCEAYLDNGAWDMRIRCIKISLILIYFLCELSGLVESSVL